MNWVNWAQMSKSDRQKVRKEMLAEAEALLNRRIGLRSTLAQVRAGARKMVDMAIAKERRAA